jgi:hypothetical protein
MAIGLAIAAALSVAVQIDAAPRPDGEFVVELVDAESLKPIAGRMHLKNSHGRPVRMRVKELNQFADHFYIDGSMLLGLRAGQYTFDLESGPEYRTQEGHFQLERHADDVERIEMSPFASLAKEGWYGGDLDVERRAADLPLAMKAETLAYAANRAEKSGNIAVDGLLICGLKEPLNVEGKTSLEVLRAAKQAGAHVVARTPFEWDLPLWLASRELDAISIIHGHALRTSVVDNEGDGRPRDKKLFPGPKGNGRWSEAIYFHALNCGLRIPPAAGSGTGENENPLGINRVYANCGDEFSVERWWEALDAGDVFVTNGPLLRPVVEGQPPGYVFQLASSAPLSLEIGLDLATREPVEYLQIIKNGDVEHEVRLDKFAKMGGKLPLLEFREGGWFTVRAVTANAKNYQFAESGPYYVERDGKPWIGKASAEFFLAWIAEAEERVRANRDHDEKQREKMLAEQIEARKFFDELRARAK